MKIFKERQSNGKGKKSFLPFKPTTYFVASEAYAMPKLSNGGGNRKVGIIMYDDKAQQGKPL